MKAPASPRANTPHSVPEPAPDILIIAASARALAQSAVKSGLRPAVIDAFCDRDTRACAVAASRVPLAAEGLQQAPLRKAFRQNLSRFGATLKGWVAGPGVENCGDLLADFARRLPLFGNDAEVFRHCAAGGAPTFAAGCGLPPVADCLGYPYLSKSPVSAGGAHIEHADGMVDDARDSTRVAGRRYRQTYLPGVGVSHLFAAHGEAVATIGFSTQWHSRHDRRRPFTYGGAINRAPLSAAERAQAEVWACRLTKALGLRGINNVDYLYCAGGLYFLEINPRPGATTALYEADYPRGLVQVHLQACRGRLPPPRPAAATRAQAVVYARRALALADDFAWPQAACDVPANGGTFEAGAPLCTLAVEGVAVSPVLSRLQQTLREFIHHINSTGQNNEMKEKYVPQNTSSLSRVAVAAMSTT